MRISASYKCSDCNGFGYYYYESDTCSTCNGRGTMSTNLEAICRRCKNLWILFMENE